MTPRVASIPWGGDYSMADLLDSLHRDHINQTRLMVIADRALDDLESGASTDFGLLEDIMRYMTDYPDLHHHPAEDVVFNKLMQREPELEGRLHAMLDEHERIIAAGRQFLAAIQAVEEDAMLRRDRFVGQGRDYLAALKAHMNIEEGELFPAARQKLTASDWDELDDLVGHRPDPLFGASIDAECARLWKLIQLHS